MAYVLDCHHHFGTLLFAAGKRAQGFEQAQIDPDERRLRVERMDRVGIDAAIIMPVNRYMRPHGAADTRRVNDEVATYRDENPARFPFAVGITEPLHGDEGLDEIRRLSDDLGMVGISYHTRWQGVATDDPLVVAGLEVVRERRLLAFIHAHTDSTMEAPFMVRHLAEVFPDLPFIVTDALSSPSQTAQLLSDVRDLPNVSVETSCAWNIRAISTSIERLGADRVVFGSDTYSAHMVTMVPPASIETLQLTAEEKAAVLSGNLIRLLEWTGRDIAGPLQAAGWDRAVVSADRRDESLSAS